MEGKEELAGNRGIKWIRYASDPRFFKDFCAFFFRSSLNSPRSLSKSNALSPSTRLSSSSLIYF